LETKDKPVEKLTFEEALKELEIIARDLEEGKISLDDSIARFERGIILKEFCRSKLDEAERKIEILQKGEGSGAGTGASTGKKVKKKRVKVKDDTGEIEDEEDIQGTLL
jgi:exodeoxyribonuclease VII small subunit